MEVLMTSPTFQERAEDLDDEDETGAEDNERDDQQDDADHKVAQVRKVEQKTAKLTLEKNQYKHRLQQSFISLFVSHQRIQPLPSTEAILTWAQSIPE